jgi:hypothetical protein
MADASAGDGKKPGVGDVSTASGYLAIETR